MAGSQDLEGSVVQKVPLRTAARPPAPPFMWPARSLSSASLWHLFSLWADALSPLLRAVGERGFWVFADPGLAHTSS